VAVGKGLEDDPAQDRLRISRSRAGQRSITSLLWGIRRQLAPGQPTTRPDWNARSNWTDFGGFDDADSFSRIGAGAASTGAHSGNNIWKRAATFNNTAGQKPKRRGLQSMNRIKNPNDVAEHPPQASGCDRMFPFGAYLRCSARFSRSSLNPDGDAVAIGPRRSSRMLLISIRG